MYSVNGRKKNTKEKANHKTIPAVKDLVCGDCGFREGGRLKEFGELFNCSKCNSENVRFTD